MGARNGPAPNASPTRGIFAASGGDIDYITIQTKGNSIHFGQMIGGQNGHVTGCSNSTRGLFGGGETPSITNIIEYITIATLGNSTNFGDLTTARAALAACASSVRGVFGSGETPTALNVIDYVTIASTGNAADFGDLTQARNAADSCSDVHGGLE